MEIAPLSRAFMFGLLTGLAASVTVYMLTSPMRQMLIEANGGGGGTDQTDKRSTPKLYQGNPDAITSVSIDASYIRPYPMVQSHTLDASEWTVRPNS